MNTGIQRVIHEHIQADAYIHTGRTRDRQTGQNEACIQTELHTYRLTQTLLHTFKNTDGQTGRYIHT